MSDPDTLLFNGILFNTQVTICYAIWRLLLNTGMDPKLNAFLAWFNYVEKILVSLGWIPIAIWILLRPFEKRQLALQRYRRLQAEQPRQRISLEEAQKLVDAAPDDDTLGA